MFGNQTSSSTFRSCRLNENILFIFIEVIEPYPEGQFKHFVKEIDRHIGIDETIPTNARLGFSVLGRSAVLLDGRQPRPQGLLLVQNGGRRNPWPRLPKWSSLEFRHANTMKCLRFV